MVLTVNVILNKSEENLYLLKYFLFRTEFEQNIPWLKIGKINFGQVNFQGVV